MANICRDFLLVSAGTSEYTLTKEDVGCCLAFVYIPINFEGLVSGLDTINFFFYSLAMNFYIIIGLYFRPGRKLFVNIVSCCKTRYLGDY